MFKNAVNLKKISSHRCNLTNAQKHHVWHSEWFLLLSYPELTLFDVIIKHRIEISFKNFVGFFLLQNFNPRSWVPLTKFLVYSFEQKLSIIIFQNVLGANRVWRMSRPKTVQKYTILLLSTKRRYVLFKL